MQLGISEEIARYRAWRRGAVQTVLNAGRADALRIHLLPPRWRPFGRQPSLVVVNGKRTLLIEASRALLLEHFIAESEPFAGRSMTKAEMRQVVSNTISRVRAEKRAEDEETLIRELSGLLGEVFDLAKGKTPQDAKVLCDYALHMRAPIHVNLLLGGEEDGVRCQHGSGGGSVPGGVLSLDQWGEVVDRCMGAGIAALSFTGWPSHPEGLADLIGRAGRLATRWIAGASPLSRELCKALRKAELDEVRLTVYSCDPAVHDRLSDGKVPWIKLSESIGNALEAGLSLVAETPLMTDNADYDATLAWLRERGVTRVACYSPPVPSAPSCSGLVVASRLSKEMLSGILASAAVYCKIHGIELDFNPAGGIDPELLGRLGLSSEPCGACLTELAVSPNGEVFPCRERMSNGPVMGNVLQNRWSKIWDNPACRFGRVAKKDARNSDICPFVGHISQ